MSAATPVIPLHLSWHDTCTFTRVVYGANGFPVHQAVINLVSHCAKHDVFTAHLALYFDIGPNNLLDDLLLTPADALAEDWHPLTVSAAMSLWDAVKQAQTFQPDCTTFDFEF